MSFTVHASNTGTVPYTVELDKDAQVADTQGRRFAPGHDIDGVIVFEVVKTAELSRLRLTGVALGTVRGSDLDGGDGVLALADRTRRWRVSM